MVAGKIVKGKYLPAETFLIFATKLIKPSHSVIKKAVKPTIKLKNIDEIKPKKWSKINKIKFPKVGKIKNLKPKIRTKVSKIIS